MVNSDTPGLPGILRLSPATRRLIYLELRMGPCNRYGDAKPSLYNLGEKHYIKDYDMSEQEELFRWGIYGLLVSCRTIHDEAAALLYSSCWFIVRYETTASLAPLRSLTPVAIASLTHLRIILNQSSCHCRESQRQEHADGCCDQRGVFDVYYQLLDEDPGWWACFDKQCRERHQDKHSPPLKASDSSSSAMLAEWHAAAAYLAPHVRPGNLELSFVCDVHEENLAAAESVVGALNLFPRLKNCHVRLSRTPDFQIRQLARDAVLWGRRISPDEPSCRPTPSLKRTQLINLPEELRLRILEYTDLITPMKEVIWASSHRKYMASRYACPSSEGRADCNGSDVHYACQFIACSERRWPDEKIGCFCYRKHAAFSSTCRCWAPPTPLFLICRTLHDDANRIFFSQNRFVLMEGEAANVFGGGGFFALHFQDNRYAATRFLREAVPVRCLRYLRFLELVFPCHMPGGWLQDGCSMAADWSDTVDWVKDKINAPVLTVRLVGLYEWNVEDLDAAAATPADYQGRNALNVYMGILRPLARLGGADGLARFYADLAWPWRWPDWRRRTVWELGWSSHSLWSRSRKQWLKERAERLVLGDRYDRLSLGEIELEPHRGWWRSVFARDG